MALGSNLDIVIMYPDSSLSACRFSLDNFLAVLGFITNYLYIVIYFSAYSLELHVQPIAKFLLCSFD